MSGGPDGAEARLAREQAFHDSSYAHHDARRVADRFYSGTSASRVRYADLLAATEPGQRALEYGCGEGSAAFSLAAAGVDVTGIDISPVAIETARAQAEQQHLTTATFAVMNAEALEFPPASFELICGTGVLHHLDLAAAYAELARTLAPGGRAVFLEPLGHNPVVNLWRRLTPSMRTPDEHPLLESDFELARRWFGDVDVEYFQLLSLGALVLPGGLRRRVEPVLDRADRWLFRRFPRLGRQAWTAVLVLSRPRPGDG
jgi:SAM-dependent methyltransferase